MMQTSPVSKQRGIGLLELMVSIMIGLFILAGVLQLYATMSQNTSTVEGASRIQENARYVFSRFERDIAQAGYAGCFSFTNSRREGIARYVNFLGHNANLGGRYNFDRYVDASNDDGLLSTDRLIVRFASGESRYELTSDVLQGADSLTVSAEDADELQQYQVAVLGDCSTFFVLMITNDPDSSGIVEFKSGVTSPGPVNDSQYNRADAEFDVTLKRSDDVNYMDEGDSPAYLYAGLSGAVEYTVGVAASASAPDTCSATTPQFCALMRNGVEIVEGVHNLQVELGWQDGAGALHFVDASGVSADDWNLADRVRVTAVFNSIERATTSTNDELLTREYSRVFLIPNQLPNSG